MWSNKLAGEPNRDELANHNSTSEPRLISVLGLAAQRQPYALPLRVLVRTIYFPGFSFLQFSTLIGSIKLYKYKLDAGLAHSARELPLLYVASL